jgi:hypothetical protein
MKRLIPLACVPAVVSILITTSPSQGEITGSLHDFSSSSWSGNQICLPCHTPHGADTSVPDAPLWNHATSTANFTLYTSTSLDATVSQPTGRSLLCLSCHDGTVARDSFGGNTGTRFISPGSTSHIGTDLRDDHPVSFTFNTALATADGGLHDPATQSTVQRTGRMLLLPRCAQSAEQCRPALGGQHRQRPLPDLPRQVGGPDGRSLPGHLQRVAGPQPRTGRWNDWSTDAMSGASTLCSAKRAAREQAEIQSPYASEKIHARPGHGHPGKTRAPLFQYASQSSHRSAHHQSGKHLSLVRHRHRSARSGRRRCR